MDLSRRLEALLEAAEQLGIDIRVEPMGGAGGGLCLLKKRRVLFVDTSADLATRYDRTVTALAGLDDLDGQYLLPEVRQDLERQRRQSK
ncbi:MAG: hypothetical protein HRF43_12890 [Phycisphaerae bacterium]|jgi:hypothetical protein